MGRYQRHCTTWLRDNASAFDLMYVDASREESSAAIEAARSLNCPVVLRSVGSGQDADAVWWNGLPHINSPPGNTEFRGIEAITALMASSGSPDNLARGVDAYDLATTTFEDVVVLADGDFVVRQHTQRSKTHSGRDYCNVYCFVVKAA